MERYNLNIESLKKHHMDLYLKIKDLDDTANIINRPEEIKNIRARNDESVLVVTSASIEYRMNSLYNPTAEAKKWADQFKFQNDNNIISLFGLGNGAFAKAIMEKMHENDFLIIYEPSYPIFDFVMHNYDLTELFEDNRVFFAIEGINDFEFHLILLQLINLTNIKTQQQCISPNYDKLFMESCVRFYREIKESLTTALVNVNSTIAFGEKNIYNTLKNMCFLSESISLIDLMKVIPKDVPAIVVAAGPSVEENIEYLKRSKGKAIIFAVDRILDYLLDQDVEPDFVVTLDPKKQMKHFSKREDVTVPLICYFESNHDILVKHKGKKIFCTSDSFSEEVYHRTKKISPNLITSGSVAIVAYSACVKLGFQRIVLVGQDLAYHNNASHAGGETDQLDSNADVFVEGLDGNQVKSRYDWKEFITRYQDFIKLNPDIEVIDVKKSGAKIKGTVHMPFGEVLEKYCQSSFDPINCDFNIFSKDDMELIKDYIEEQISIIMRIKEKAQNAVKVCNQLLKSQKNERFTFNGDKSLKKLSKINSYIMEQKIYGLIDSFVTAKTAQYLSEILIFTEDEKENNRSTFYKSKAIYQAVIEAADFTKKYLDEAIFDL